MFYFSVRHLRIPSFGNNNTYILIVGFKPIKIKIIKHMKVTKVI